ncbi:unannotated protein [freshwater metagenome]|uniref:Unannotated protein n=1 Tax=freshwater metagenome TaxID=449393 RepID=A0A6J7T6P0_9ZZZZ|nr:DnaJ domain-containing protein [Actinomycetota bacterium]MTB03681.1 DnaJ domain-containing protein [Actinomycetota bacterium]
MNSNPYKLLGVNVASDEREIRQAYRTLAKKAHPDRGGDAQIFDQFTQAYQLLMDTQKRQEYDRGTLLREPQKPTMNDEPFNTTSHLPSFTLGEAFHRILVKNYKQASFKDEVAAFRNGTTSPSSKYFALHYRRFSFHYSEWFNPSIFDEFMLSDYIANIVVMFPVFFASRLLSQGNYFGSSVRFLFTVVLPSASATLLMIYFIKWRKTWKKFGVFDRFLLIALCAAGLSVDRGWQFLGGTALWYLALTGILRSYADTPTRPAQLFAYFRKIYDKI